MKIDPKTKENFRDACLSQTAVAAKLGLPVSTFSQVVNGTYPNLNGKKAQKAIGYLRDSGLLVLVSDEMSSDVA